MISQSNADKFRTVTKGLKQLGFSAEELSAVNTIIAAVIHIGDMEFKKTDSSDNTDKCRVADVSQVDIGTSVQPSSADIILLATMYLTNY